MGRNGLETDNRHSYIRAGLLSTRHCLKSKLNRRSNPKKANSLGLYSKSVFVVFKVGRGACYYTFYVCDKEKNFTSRLGNE